MQISEPVKHPSLIPKLKKGAQKKKKASQPVSQLSNIFNNNDMIKQFSLSKRKKTETPAPSSSNVVQTGNFNSNWVSFICDSSHPHTTNPTPDPPTHLGK